MVESMSVRMARHAFHEFRENFPEIKDDDRAFELFSAYCVVKQYSIDPDSLTMGLTGGGQDGGIDWLYVIYQGKLVSDFSEIEVENITKTSEIRLIIGQAKNSVGFKADVGNKFLMTFGDLFSGSSEEGPQRNYSDELMDAVERFSEFWFDAARRRPKLAIEVYYCSFADRDAHADVKTSMNLSLAPLRESFGLAVVDYRLVGAKELYARYGEAPSYDADLKYQVELDGNASKISLVKLTDYYEFLKGPDGEINRHFFEQNVRDYEGGVTVNRQIREGLEDPSKGSDFWWLNNGITMLVSESPVSRERVYSLSDVQIVNGLQTSHTVFNYFSEDERRLQGEDRSVMVKILSSADEQEKANIIRATNSQTSVQQASLRATDDIHRDIESILALNRLYYDRRKNYYKNIGKPVKDIISIVSLSQSMMSAFLMAPDTARARPSSFLGKNVTYDEIFDSSRDLEDFVWAAQKQRWVNECLTRDLGASSSVRNNLKFYVLLGVRVLGAHSQAKASSRSKAVKPRWSVKGCRNDWSPSRDQVYSIAQWVRDCANELAEEQEKTLDKVCKGPELQERLKKQWENRDGLADSCLEDFHEFED